ncbi:MAG: murein hydrolase activator EnvC family protein [Candidatus Absconditicoccaceae bacterium]
MKVVWFGSLMVFSLSTLLSPQVFAQSGTSLLGGSAVSVASQEAMLQDSAFKTAVDQVAGLRLSLFDFKKKLDQMDSSTKELHAGEFDAEYKLIRAEMVKVIQDIDYSTAKITRTLRTLYTHKQNLQKTLDELQETRKHLEIGKKYLNQLLLLVYKVEREIYDEEGEQIDAVKLFIKSDAMPQLLAGDDTLKILLNQINTLMKEATMQEKQKSDTIDKFVKLRTQAQKSLDYYKTEIKKLEQKKAYLMSFMQLYNEKKLGAEAVSGVSSEEVNLHETINTMVADIVEKKYLTTNDLPEKIKQLADHTDSSENETSPAAWPTYPISQILTIFKDPAFEKEYGFKNLSLKLAVEQGTPVYAMRDGIVYYTDTGSGNVNRMMILHTDGYISTYAYLSRIFVQQGDFVRRGQIIAQSGGEPGTEGAGFVSKGENLTFSLFKDGVAIDPLTVLDLSVVQDKDKVLPEEYRLKYFNDQYVRPIDITKVSLIKGDSVDERAQTFLNSYAVGTYRNVAFWDQVVAGTNIDRDMVICIGFAESTLGKFLATDNNIGNVGNNDRGDRIAYNNPFNGARLIPLTLNNQYLGNYHTIKQLSRYGNSDGKIYASSPINWQSNVQKCLSKIKGYYVPEDFPFRTGPNPNTQAGAAFLREAKEEKTMLMSGSVMKKIGGVEVSSL